MLTNEEKTLIAEFYYKNNASRLKKEVNKVLKHINCDEKDRDEFVDMANSIFGEALFAFDRKYSLDAFNGFLFRILENNFKDEWNYRKREKRRNYLRDKDWNVVKKENEDGEKVPVVIPDLRLDAPLDENIDGSCTIESTIPSNFDMDKEIFGVRKNKIDLYMNRLSPKQREIVTLLVSGYEPGEIRKIMKIPYDQFAKHMANIQSIKNVSILFD